MALPTLFGHRTDDATAPRAVIDIGSNSLRLVIYAGPQRLPTVILNEKVGANLGRSLSDDGMLPAKSVEVALRGLARFARLIALAKVDRVHTVATAAVRDAGNGAAFLAEVRALGLMPRLLTGDQEAQTSAMGVLSAFPNADGIVGDLGGGSLELIELADGTSRHAESFPLGTLRLPALRQKNGRHFARRIDRMLGPAWKNAAGGRDLFLVGGSWRALTQVAMDEQRWPLADPHGFAAAPESAAHLARVVARASAKRLRDIPGISGSRVASMPDAAALLDAVVRHLRPARLVTSSFGLREGLLYCALDDRERALDPFLVACRHHVARCGRDPADGDRLATWITPLFAGEPAHTTRLRSVACMLASVVRQEERQLRPDRAVAIALRERWVGIDAAGRAMLAAALLASVGRRDVPADLTRLASAAALGAACRWGMAIRLADRLVGSASAALASMPLSADGDALTLHLPPQDRPLYAEGAEQQHRALAQALELKAVLA